jgi:hypothetical protein
MFDMDQKEGFLASELGAYEQIDFVFESAGHVSKNLFVEGDDGDFPVEMRADIGQKQVDKIDEKGAEEFFEQAVVIHAPIVPAYGLRGGTTA